MEQYRIRTKEASPAFYLTLVSIIQSLALGYLLSGIKPARLFADTGLLYGLMCLATLQIVILTWHEYAVGSICFRTVLDYFDSLIPFLFGIAQWAVIAAINQETPFAWFVALMFYTAVSLMAYTNQGWKSRREQENAALLEFLGGYHRQMITFPALSLLSFALFAAAAFYFGRTHAIMLVLVLATNITLVWFAFRSNRLWRGVVAPDATG